MKKFAVVLTGCGYLDGSEITEAISTLIALSAEGVNYQVFAPDKSLSPINHLTSDPEEGQRDLMTEAARISRGQVRKLDELKADEFDAVVFPGGFGAAKHLTNWAEKGSQCEVHPEARRVVQEFYSQSKPIGALCIAPTLIAKVLGPEGVTLTIGKDQETAGEIEKTGAHHEICPVDDYISDRGTKVVTTPAYMYSEARPDQVFKGVSGLVRELVEMA